MPVPARRWRGRLIATSPVAIGDQLRALAEGAVLGGYDGRRWRGAGAARDGARRFVICGVDRRAGRRRRRARPGRGGRAGRARGRLVQPGAGARRRARQPDDAGRAGAASERDPGRGAGADRPGAGGSRRAGGGRSVQRVAAAPARAPPPSRGRAAGTAAGAGRQGRDVRYRRLLPEAEVRDRAPESRHGRRRGGDRRAWRDRRAGAASVGDGVRARLREPGRRHRDPSDRRDHDRVRA